MIRNIPIAKTISDNFLQQYPYLISINESFYRYDKGYYKKVDEDIIRKKLFELDNTAYNREVEDAVKRIKIHRRNKIPYYPDLINLNNGIFDLESNQLIPHDPKYIFTSKTKYDYVPSATCPNFEKFLSEIVNPDTLEYMWKLIGFLLNPIIAVEKGWIFEGNGANGKTTLMNILRELLIPENCYMSNPTSQSELERTLPNLENKKIWFISEVPRKTILSSAILKRYTSGEIIPAKWLYKENFDMQPTGKIIITANDLPNFKDNTYGMMRKFDIIEFPNKFEQDLTLYPILLKELPGIFNMALKYRKKFMDEGSVFRKSSSTSDFNNDEWAYNNPVALFREQVLLKKPGNIITVDLVFIEYQVWCAMNNIKPMSKPWMSRELKKLDLVSYQNTYKSNERYYKDIGVYVPEKEIPAGDPVLMVNPFVKSV